MVFQLFEQAKRESRGNGECRDGNNAITGNDCCLVSDPIQLDSSNQRVGVVAEEDPTAATIAAPSRCAKRMRSLLSSSDNRARANQSHQRHPETPKRVPSVCSIYTLFTLMFICICAISALLMVHINRATDIDQIRAGLKAQFLSKSDVRALVQDILNDLRGSEEARSWNQR